MDVYQRDVMLLNKQSLQPSSFPTLEIWLDCGGFTSAESTINALYFQYCEDKEVHHIFQQEYHFQQA